MTRHRAGMTLLELMVGLVLLGLLLVVLENGVQLGLRAWRTDGRLSGSSEDLAVTDRVLRQLLVRMDPGIGHSAVNLAGQRQELDFTTLLPASTALPTRRIDARLLVDDRHRLVLRWKPHFHERPLARPPQEQETLILEAVDLVEFSYWQNAPNPGWRSAWTDQALPSLVRVHLAFPRGSTRRWPDFVAAPLLELAGG